MTVGYTENISDMRRDPEETELACFTLDRLSYTHLSSTPPEGRVDAQGHRII